jgi:hypothetical protein
LAGTASLAGTAILLTATDLIRESKIGIREREIERDQNDGEGVGSYQIQSRVEERTKQPRGQDEPSSSGVKSFLMSKALGSPLESCLSWEFGDSSHGKA